MDRGFPPFEPPKTPLEAAVLLNPASSVALENINGALALIATDIPMSYDSSIFFYQDDKKHSFDYVDLSPSEESEHSTIDAKKMHDEYKSYKRKDTTSFQNYVAARSAIRERLRGKGSFMGRLANLLNRSPRPATNDSTTLSEEQSVSNQMSELSNRIFDVFRLLPGKFDARGIEEDRILFQKFLEVIRANPQKPFLIVYGHGGTIRTGEGPKWSIGEQGSARRTYLKDVFHRMRKLSEKKPYSAILLVSCNSKSVIPDKMDDIPLFFVQGEAGFDSENRRANSL